MSLDDKLFALDYCCRCLRSARLTGDGEAVLFWLDRWLEFMLEPVETRKPADNSSG
jgi:hypothetical protein